MSASVQRARQVRQASLLPRLTFMTPSDTLLSTFQALQNGLPTRHRCLYALAIPHTRILHLLLHRLSIRLSILQHFAALPPQLTLRKREQLLFSLICQLKETGTCRDDSGHADG